MFKNMAFALLQVATYVICSIGTFLSPFLWFAYLNDLLTEVFRHFKVQVTIKIAVCE